MNACQTSLFIQAQAIIAEIEGMKACNDAERILGNSPKYGYTAFDLAGMELRSLAHEMKQV